MMRMNASMRRMIQIETEMNYERKDRRLHS